MKPLLKKYINTRYIGRALLTLLFIAGISQILFNSYKLLSNRYAIHSYDVYKIGTFKMFAKAYYYGGAKYASPRYTFQSRDGYSFTIERPIIDGITDKKELRDTLQYHELAFTVYSDKETFERFQHTSKPIHIDVLQFQIGNKNYIDFDKVNQGAKTRLIMYTVFLILLLLFVFFGYYRKGLSHPAKEVVLSKAL